MENGISLLFSELENLAKGFQITKMSILAFHRLVRKDIHKTSSNLQLFLVVEKSKMYIPVHSDDLELKALLRKYETVFRD